MSRLILTVALGIAALCPLSSQLLAATISFTGVVDEVRPDQGNLVHLAVGDAFSGTFHFRAEPPNQFGTVFGVVNDYSVTIGNFNFSGTTPHPHLGSDFVAVQPDPGQGFVVYEVGLLALNPTPYVQAGVDATLQTNTPTGVIPPVEQFTLNVFIIGLFSPTDPTGFPDAAIGHLTSLPSFDLASVPDSGRSVTLLSFGLLAITALWFGLPCKGATQ